MQTDRLKDERKERGKERERERDQKQVDFPEGDVDARYRGRGGVKGVRGLTGERGNIRLEVGKRL